MKDNSITIETSIDSNLHRVWDFWTLPNHIVKWNNATEDWFTPRAENNLKVDGKFNYRMEAKDGSMGFDFEGTYTKIIPYKLIVYKLGDDREVKIEFKEDGERVKIIETFEPEIENSIELQKNGWQAILNNFKTYVES